MKNLSLFTFLLFIVACSNPAGNNSTEPAAPSAAADTVDATPVTSAMDTVPPAEAITERSAAMPANTVQKEFTSGQLTFTIENSGNERGASAVKVKGSKPNVFTKEFPMMGQVDDAFLLDLNQDGFSELYIALAKPDGILELKGIASYRDRSAGEIYVKDSNAKRQAGTDRLFAEDGKLFRTFTNPSGETVRLTYVLKKGEAGFLLSPAG